MVRLIRALLAVGAIALLGASIPTPGPGTAIPLSQPTPINPVQYVVAPGAIGSSAALNSTFYKVYGDLNAVINALNACSFIPGAAIGTITAISPLNVSIGSCSSGTGTGATATLSLTGVVPQANLPTSPVFAGTIGATVNGTASYVPPVYSNSGSVPLSTEHIVSGNIAVAVGTGATNVNATVTLSGAAVFTNSSSYQLTYSYNNAASTFPPGWSATALTFITNNHSATTFTILVQDGNTSTGSTGVLSIDYFAIGY